MFQRFRPTFAVLVAATALALPGFRLAPGATAKAALPQATAIAGKWRPDAALTHVSSITVNPDGTASSWIYTFYSPKTSKTLNVTMSPGAPVDTLEVPNTSMIPVGDFVDSDVAMKEAAKHQLKGSSPSMGLVVMGSTGAATWSVNGGFAEGDVSVVLVGKTGAFIRRQVISYK